MIIINKNRPIRFKIKGLIIIILPEPRNDYNHTSGRRDDVSRLTTKYVPKTQGNCTIQILIPAKRYARTCAENKHGYSAFSL